ncbi:hypothetical protein SNOG_08535 [Parastagonospora nodorum SN15]|uniref:Uncharacterized protein n=1 Tax=Phaeosphaeria nodorum (strain SN15 / ATCC MYA-4574 / FGSC 10173) TaxID=321614 RepID=Q0UI79_PHANO|nr:hypothetical protein SNOG_08535 [Parastagonospora nodorum SN15]EAT83703.1 hypothetical protein SNOG_08535 [Parastagonospora nodorum SN15]
MSLQISGDAKGRAEDEICACRERAAGVARDTDLRRFELHHSAATRRKTSANRRRVEATSESGASSQPARQLVDLLEACALQQSRAESGLHSARAATALHSLAAPTAVKKSPQEPARGRKTAGGPRSRCRIVVTSHRDKSGDV